MAPRAKDAAAAESKPQLPALRQCSFPMVLENWQAFTNICQSLSKSGKTGEMRTTESILAVAIAGAELGFAPMTAVNYIYPIKGKLALSAQAAQALVLRDLPGSRFEINEGDDFCEVKLAVPGRQEYTARFTMKEAKDAGLVKTDSNWMKHPKDMLFSKAVLRACRRVAPDVLCGMYAPEEFGEIVDIAATPSIDTTATEKPAAASSSSAATATAPTIEAEIVSESPQVVGGNPSPPPAASVNGSSATTAAAAAPVPTAAANGKRITDPQVSALKDLRTKLAMGNAQWLSILATYDAKSAMELSEETADKMIGLLRNRLKVDSAIGLVPAGAAGGAPGN